MSGLKLPSSPEDCPEPDWRGTEHRFREYRLKSGHTLTVEFPGPCYHPKMGATDPVHPVVGAVAWRWLFPGQPWRPVDEDEILRADVTAADPRRAEEEKGVREYLRGGGSLFAALPDD